MCNCSYTVDLIQCVRFTYLVNEKNSGKLIIFKQFISLKVVVTFTGEGFVSSSNTMEATKSLFKDTKNIFSRDVSL
jgi:hypothetical protein